MKLIINIFLLLLFISSCSPSPDRSELFKLTDSIIDSLPPIKKTDIGEEVEDKTISTKDGKYEIHCYYFSRSIIIYANQIYDDWDLLTEYEELQNELSNRYSNNDKVNEVKMRSSQFGNSIEIDCNTPIPIQKDLNINEEFKMEWSSLTTNDFSDIVKIIVKYKLKMCGEFYWKGSIQDPNKYLIACTPNGKSFNIFIVNTLGDGWIESLNDDEKAELKKPY